MPIPRRLVPSALLGLTFQSRLLGTTVSLAAFNLLTLVGLAIQDVVIAATFGTQSVVGAFVLAHTVPKQVFTVVAASIVTAFVPAYVAARERGDSVAAQRLVGSVTGLGIALLSALGLLLALLTPTLLTLLLPSDEGQALTHFVRLLYILLPSVVIHGLAIIWLGVTTATGRFKIGAASTALIPTVAILSLVRFGPSVGIYALAWGTVIGYVAHLTVLGLSLRAQGVRLTPYPIFLSQESRSILAEGGLAAASASLISAALIVDQSFAASLGPRSVAALSYGNKISTVITAVANASIGAAALPYFSRLVSRANYSAILRSVLTLIALVLCATLPIAALLYAASPALISVAFERGAFTAADSALVASVQSMYALHLPLYVVSLVLLRTLAALRLNRVIALGTLSAFIANVIFDYYLLRLMGVPGIALATAVSYVTLCSVLGLALLAALRRRRANPPNELPLPVSRLAGPPA